MNEQIRNLKTETKIIKKISNLKTETKTTKKNQTEILELKLQ